MDPVPGQRAPFAWIRDTSVMRGGDGAYYMTGTSGSMDAIHIWRSPDLKRFTYMKAGYSLNSSDSSAWYNAASRRLLWAPELHYLNGNYYIPFSLSLKLGMGLVKSTTGKPEGPYQPTYEGNHAFVAPRIDASLFQDDDGTPYFLWQGRYLRKLTPDLSGFAGDEVELLTVDGEEVGYEGIFMAKIGKWYVLTAAEWNGGRNHDDGTYDMMYAVSKNIRGPYSRRRCGVPHAGHSTMFQDAAGRWNVAFFGNDRTAPFRASAGVAPIEIRDTGTDLIIEPAR
jgi:beta-xylosidase